MTGQEPVRLPPEVSDALVHLARALQRLGLMLIPIDPECGIERLPPEVIHAVARAFDTAPVPERLRNPPEDVS